VKTPTGILLCSVPVAAINLSAKNTVQKKNLSLKKSPLILDSLLQSPAGKLDLTFSNANDFTLRFSNRLQDELLLGYDAAKNIFYADRSRSGMTAFHASFPAKAVMPRFCRSVSLKYTVIWDRSSVEIFADDGLSVQTVLVFPRQPYSSLELKTANNNRLEQLRFAAIR
jgi:fructan beta-fructosidase